MISIRETVLGAKRWISAHPRMLLLAIPIYFVAQFGFEVWSIFNSIPNLPNGPLQMVGVSSDGARFVVLNDRGRPRGGNTITILVVLREPLHNEHGVVRFAVKENSWIARTVKSIFMALAFTTTKDDGRFPEFMMKVRERLTASILKSALCATTQPLRRQ